ncbi:MAG: hypothetical protein K2Y28_16275 [Burkholderiaceae bacterium]|nr:hypothetical protein [Burkholderiaceae bacterium]
MNKRVASELEQRLVREVMEKIDGKERVDVTKATIQRYRQSIENSEAARKKFRETQDRYITWFARIVVIPSAILTGLYMYVIVHDLVRGEVLEISRYRYDRVSIHQAPGVFWFALAYHVCIVAFSGFITSLCWRGAKWCRKWIS